MPTSVFAALVVAPPLVPTNSLAHPSLPALGNAQRVAHPFFVFGYPLFGCSLSPSVWITRHFAISLQRCHYTEFKLKKLSKLSVNTLCRL